MPIRPLRELITAGLIVLATGAGADPRARLVGSFRWYEPMAWFGGLSGIELDAGGTRMTVLGDQGRLITARLTRDKGRITGVQILGETRLKDESGKPLKRRVNDSEGLAQLPGGGFAVSFEFRHRVDRYASPKSRANPLPLPPDIRRLAQNSGFEALARHPGGALYTLPERSGGLKTPFPLYRYDGVRWQVAAQIPRRGPFLPVGADFDDHGRLYLLERAVTPLGFRSRIRRFDLSAANLGEVILVTTFPWAHDNLEGIAVWQDAGGNTRLTMVSDDNFLRIQRTELVDYIVTE